MKTRQSGFTLLEVMLAISLAGIVFAVVSAAFVISLEASEDSTERLSGSQDGAFTSAYFTRDIQSAKTISTGTGQCSAAGTLVLSATWTDEGVSPTQTYKVDYRLVAGSAVSTLVRYSCGSAPSTDSVASRLQSASAACQPSCASAKSVTLSLNGISDGDFTITANRRLS